MSTSSYAYNPQLSFVKEGYPGNRLINGCFTNEEKDVDASYWKVLKWKLSKNPQREEKANDPFQLPVVENHTFAQSKEDLIVWLGHATFFIRLNGVSLLTDPVVGDVSIVKRKSPLPCKVEDVQPIDYILLSHGHRDHLDKPSLRQITNQNLAAKLLVPLKMEPLIRSFGVANSCQEAGWYQRFQIREDLEIIFLPAVHWHRRGLADFNAILWGSFLIKSPQKTIYFAGDSAYGAHFKNIRQLIGEIDVCLLPIGAYKPPFIMDASHLNPQEAVRAFNDLGGKLFIPMHYGTFDLSDEPLGEPIRYLREEEKKGSIKGALKVLAVGENGYLS